MSGAVTLAIALGIYVYEITGRELDIGLVGLAEFLPTFLLVLWAGALADRVDRRKLACAGYLAEAIIALLIMIYVAKGGTAIWPLITLTVAFGTARGFVNPATRALPANVVPRSDLPRLIPALSTVWQLSAIISPLIVGAVYGLGPHWTFLAIAGLDTISALTIRNIKLDSPQTNTLERPSLANALGGLRLVRRTPLLLAVIGLDLFAVLLGGVIALAPAISTNLLSAGESAPFWLRSAGAVGAAVTAVALARTPLAANIGKTLLKAVAIFGGLTILVAFSRNLAITLFLFAALAAADMVSVFIRATIVPLATPDSLRGRVLAVEAVFIGASNELGAFESGITAEWFGLVPAIIISGIATILVVLLFAIFVPDLRKLNHFDEITDGMEPI
tara:strand:- start:103 stop:1272 length:1170 start_codon:yes stop_codon:yes gene_type:complete